MRANAFLKIASMLALASLLGPQAVADETPAAAQAPANPQAAAPAACTLSEVVGLDMVTDVTGIVGVPVKFNRKDAILGVDTGSLLSSISVPLVNELDLRHHDLPKGEFGFFGGVKVRYTADIQEFSLGVLHAKNVRFLVLPSDITDMDIDGLLGPDIMHHYDVELDFAGGKFNMFLPNQCNGDVVYWTRSGYALVPMEVQSDWGIKVQVTLDGKTFDAVIDTGSTRSVLTMEAAKDLFGLDENSPGVVSLGDLGLNNKTGNISYSYRFKAINFGGVTVNNPDIVLVTRKQLGDGPPALIGISILRQLHLYIAYKEQKLYVTPAQVIEPPVIASPATPSHALPSSAPSNPKAPIASATKH
jgi:aspartyl protease